MVYWNKGNKASTTRVMVHCSGSSRDEDREATMVATTAAVAATVTVVVTTKVTSTAV